MQQYSDLIDKQLLSERHGPVTIAISCVNSCTEVRVWFKLCYRN